MKSYKTIANLQSIKIKLLEEFILEANRLAEKYMWVSEPEEMTIIDQLSNKLDDITKQINIENLHQ